MNPESKSETPRTDAEHSALYQTYGDYKEAKYAGIATLARQLEKELNEAKDLLRHFVTHFEVTDYSESTYDEVEKVAVSLWGVVKERNTLAKQLEHAQELLTAERLSAAELAKQNHQLLERVKELELRFL